MLSDANYERSKTMPVAIEESNYVETWTHGSESLRFQIESKDEGRLRVEFENNDDWEVLLDEPINNGRTEFIQKGFSNVTTIRLACTWKDDHNKKEVPSSPEGNGTWTHKVDTFLVAWWDFTGEDDPDWRDQKVTITVIN